MNVGRGVSACVVAAAVVGLAGCAGSTARGGSDQPGVELPASAVPGPAGEAARKSIGSASEQDIAASLRANGVDDAEEWADLIVANRPYPGGDPGLDKLRQVLVKRDAPPEVISKITNALEP